MVQPQSHARSESDAGLSALREEIDRIDDALHALLLERAAVVDRIKATKGADRNGEPAMRPEREAALMRRRAARHSGPLPFDVIHRLWREIITASTLLQTPLRIAVHRSEDQQTLGPLARDHFGGAPMRDFNSAIGVVRAVAEDRNALGVVAEPRDTDETDPNPWWRLLIGDDADRLRVIARLPFTDGDKTGALVLGRVAPAASGKDASMIYLELAEPMSRGGMQDLLQKNRMTLRRFCARSGGEDAMPQLNQPDLHLIEVEGFFADDDERLTRLGEALSGRLLRLGVLGAYALP